MFKKSIILSIICFSLLTVTTSVIKNKARNLEKDISKLEKEIFLLEKEFSDAEIDFIYLSSPERIIKNFENFNKERYLSINKARIFFSINHFINHETKQSKHKKEIFLND